MRSSSRRIILFFLVSFCLFPHLGKAAFMSAMSDQISWSIPSATTTHRIRFQTTNTIPPSGEILLYHDDGALDIPALLDFTDLDLAVTASSSSPYVDRTLAAVATGANDGVSVTPGSVPGTSQILITLNSTTGIPAGNFVEIEIGTNATFGVVGDQMLVNSALEGSYRVRIITRTGGGAVIDTGTVMYAIVQGVTMGPVDTTDVNPPVISNGLPSGILPGSTANVEFSVNTDKFSICRYDTASGTPYESMVNTFTFTNTTLHRRVTAVSQATTYNFFIRCSGVALGSATNTSDYLLSFSIGTFATGTGATTTPTPPPPPPGGSGHTGGGNFLGKADVIFTGLAFPLAPITLLRDNVVEWEFPADIFGKLETTRYGYERGPQSFSMYAQDKNGRRTSTYTGTIYLIANTTNLVGPIYLSPVLSITKNTIDPGERVEVTGLAIPLLEVEVFLQKQGGGGDGSILRGTTTASVTGEWNLSISTTGLPRGTYELKARTIVSSRDQSIFSPIVYVGVGESPTPDFSLRADLNKDKKVNLIDFSILLFNWRTTDAIADINQDGTVDLRDFSIMVFYWTG